ncbi:MAG: hypothetical protein R3B48_25135 [Kofleriaceae bacterium]
MSAPTALSLCFVVLASAVFPERAAFGAPAVAPSDAPAEAHGAPAEAQTAVAQAGAPAANAPAEAHGAAPTAAPAQATASARSPHVALDLELDPIAYLLEGSSLHVGLRRGHLRADLGVFAATVPQFMHGQDGFRDQFHGWGVKLDWAARADGLGPFAGVEAAVAIDDVVDLERSTSARATSWLTGVRAGWRLRLTHDLYVAPWIGVAYRGGEVDIDVGGRTFQRSAWVVFPTVHLGLLLPR